MAVESKDVVAQMRATLALSEPDLDTTVGTTTRKILDTVGEVIAEAYVDRYLLDYQYDIDTKAGADLDDFVALFGFTRLVAKRATGSVTFERSSASETESFIPRGTQLATEDTNQIVVATLVPALMMRNDTSVTVPAQAVIGGTSGNIGANALSRAITPLDGVGTFTNSVAFTGGTEAESDEQLRNRFKRTIFRNLAGTEQMFHGTALEDPDVTQVNVLGASKTQREQIEVVSGTATATALAARYVYPGTAVFGPDIDAGAIYTEGVHYSFNYTTRVVTILGGLVPDGIYDLEYEFVPDASRNDPANGATNRIDVYVKGERAVGVEEIAVFRTSKTFTNGTSDLLYRQKFRRVGSDVAPTAGHYFVNLAYGPMVSASTNGVLVINGTTYTLGTHFWAVNDITRDGGTVRSLSGLEIASSVSIPDLTTFTAPYAYNAVPGDVEQAVRSWRLVTTDARVHTARLVRLRLHFVVILEPGAVAATVQGQVETALAVFLDTVDFAGVVQVSDLLGVVQGVTGVDAVRFATDADHATAYAIQKVAADGTVQQTYATTSGTPKRALDITLEHDQVPQFHSVTFKVKAANTFGAV